MSAASRHPSDSEPPDWFVDRQRAVRYDRAAVIRFIAGLRQRLARGREFAVCIASDAALERANHRFRGKRAPTDVLSFPDDEGYVPDRVDRSLTVAAQKPTLSLGALWAHRERLQEVITQSETYRLGDILISAQRARAQARRLGHTIETELEILLLHGLLHLLGEDHERDQGRMRRREQSWRRRLGLPAGMIERAEA